MSRTFSMVSAQDPGALLTRARRVATNNNATFSGNETAGSFSGSGFKGLYKMNGKSVTVTITQKPFYAPWPLVESELEKLLV
jgi:hypothetical protein